MFRKLSISLAIVSIIALLPYIFGFGYIWKALIYNYVDYDDYKIFDNREIAFGAAQPWHIAKKQLEIPESLDAYLEKMETIGFLAIKNDSIIFEKYYQGFNQHTIANSFSVAKSYITMLVGFAIQDGLIESIDDKLIKYLPDLDSTIFGDISIKHLCTMSSGLEWTESYGGPINHTTEGYYGTNIEKTIKSLKKENDAGAVYKYKGCDPQLLAFVITKTTGKTLSEYLSEKFWKPVGSENPGLWSLDQKDGLEKAYCCINTTVRDFARIGKLYLNHGKWNGKQILDSNWIAKSSKPSKLLNEKNEETLYYGYQWWCMQDLDKDVFYARGLNGQYVICFPNQDLIIVRIGEKRETAGNHPTDLLKYVEWGETL
ncbi:MAG: serine hydrolase [Bacteroidia bacterium]